MIRRISITGPESTGKTTLAEKLAKRFHTIFVPEYARTYIDLLDRPYRFDDLLIIAKKQYIIEQEMIVKANDLLFCDTDFIVLKIWSQEKFGRCDPWISHQVTHHPYGLYLLTNIDLPWVGDPQREDQFRRDHLFNLYKKELDNINANYHIISGLKNERLTNAIKYITNQYQ